MRACHTVILLPDGTRAGTWTPNCWVRVRCVAITPHELICDKLLPFSSHDESAYPIRTHSFHSLSAALPTQAGRICSDLLAPCTGFEPASRFRPNAFKTPSSPPGHTAYVELLIGVEPMTSSLPWMRSTYWTIEAFSFAKTKKNKADILPLNYFLLRELSDSNWHHPLPHYKEASVQMILGAETRVELVIFGLWTRYGYPIPPLCYVVEPDTGLEPATTGLRYQCSAIELIRHGQFSIIPTKNLKIFCTVLLMLIRHRHRLWVLFLQFELTGF